MAKSRRTVTVPIPTYEKNRSRWRRNIWSSALKARAKGGVQYSSKDRLEVVVLLYLRKGKRHDIHDVDNRLKDILDALQGRFRGPQSGRTETRLIENDNQVCRVVMEKQPIPKLFGDDAGGRLLIRPYKAHRWPLQPTKGHRLFKRPRKHVDG
jgi:Holliday junction resolvase RusA-like endonuclease